MIQMSAAANSATPITSRSRRDSVDRLTTSNLHDDGQDEGPPPRTLAKKPSQLHSQLLLDEPLIGPLLDAGLLDHVAQDARAVGQQGLTVFHDEPACDDVGHALEGACLLVDGHDGHDQAIFGQMTTIAQYLV